MNEIYFQVKNTIHSICDNINKQLHMENITHYLDTLRIQIDNRQSIL